jgi:hypothetical protein
MSTLGYNVSPHQLTGAVIPPAHSSATIPAKPHATRLLVF